MRTSDELDPDLVELLHRAADTIAGYGGDLAAVVSRRRARRYRQVLVAGFAAVVAAAVLVAGAGLVRPGSRPDSRPAFPTALGRPSAQRLFITPVGTFSYDSGRWIGVNGNYDLGEVLPSGQLVMHNVAGLSQVAAAVALPDGGMAALGMPAGMSMRAGTEGQISGRFVPVLTLVVLRPDGSQRLLRNDVGYGIVGADEQQVYVYDAAGNVSAVDLTTGQRRTVPWGTQVTVPAVLGAGHAIDLIGDPPGPDATTCTVRVLDAASGDRLSDSPIPVEDCGRYGQSLSPDGRLLALVQPPAFGADAYQTLLVVIDVTTGEQLVRQVLDASGDFYFGGVCWSDPHHVWAAWFHLPVPAVRLYSKAETLRQAVVPVPGS